MRPAARTRSPGSIVDVGQGTVKSMVGSEYLYRGPQADSRTVARNLNDVTCSSSPPISKSRVSLKSLATGAIAPGRMDVGTPPSTTVRL